MTYSTFKISLPPGGGALAAKTLELLDRHLRERADMGATAAEPSDEHLRLLLRPDLGAEAFQLEDDVDGVPTIAGGDGRGLLYGVGKFLRDAAFAPGLVSPGAWRGVSRPDSPVRGIYFATHFHNFYHDAPVAAVQRYIEDLALWGVNSIQVWFDMHHFEGIADPAAVAMIERLHVLLRAAKGVGMRLGLGVLANEGYRTTPEELRATRTTRAHYGVEVCPATDAGMALVERNMAEEFDAFADIGLDQLWIWPYDQGGCACPQCQPWGAKGFLKTAKAVARCFRQRCSEGKVILSTWLFDYQEDEGEWRALAEDLRQSPDWLDYVLADSHTEFPRFPLENGVPGDLPLLNFPEISMWGMGPWGGFGANPLPRRFERLWRSAAHQLGGGFPYSEGIFEDLNKIVCAQLYWSKDRPIDEIVREYAHAYFGPDVVDDAARAVELMEAGHGHNCQSHDPKDDAPYKLTNADAADAEQALACCRRADAAMPAPLKASWRWRILLLRAQLDAALLETGGGATDATDACFAELTGIYHAQGAERAVAPPGRVNLARLTGAGWHG